MYHNNFPVHFGFQSGSASHYSREKVGSEKVLVQVKIKSNSMACLNQTY